MTSWSSPTYLLSYSHSGKILKMSKEILQLSKNLAKENECHISPELSAEEKRLRSFRFYDRCPCRLFSSTNKSVRPQMFTYSKGCPCSSTTKSVEPQMFTHSRGTQTQGGQRSDLQGRNASHAASSWRYPGRVWQGSNSSSGLVGGESSFSEYVTGNGIRESFRNTKIHKSQSLCHKTSMITIRAHFWK